jgi:predicted TIM-barrel fold metal-dependent hydrolase
MGTENAMLIDADGHVQEDIGAIATHLPKAYRENLHEGVKQMLFPPLDHFHPPATNLTGSDRGQVGPEGWIDFLEDIGIRRTVLYPSYALSIGKVRDVNWAIALVRAYNDWLYETYLSANDRFQGMGLLPLQDVDAATAELQRCVTELGMRGAMLPAHGLPLNLGSKVYWPVYELANELDAAIAVHGGSHDGFGFDDVNVYAVAHAYGHAFGQLVSCAGMVVNGLFDRYPRLRVAFLEGGVAWLLLALERLDESFETHVPIESTNLFSLKEGQDPRKYILNLLREGRIQVGVEGGEADLPYVIEKVGETPFMYSSDFPHEVTNETCRQQLKSMRERLGPSAAASVLGTNAARFYKLESAA